MRCGCATPFVALDDNPYRCTCGHDLADHDADGVCLADAGGRW